MGNIQFNSKDILVIIQKGELNWQGTINGDLVCDFEYFKDGAGLFWVNNISTFEPHNQKGFGTKMIQAALIIYGEIYISSAEKDEIKTMGINGDLRYTNAPSFDESDLKIFVNELIIQGVFKKEWVKHPFKNY